MLNTYIYHQFPPTCFSVCYTIFRETQHTKVEEHRNNRFYIWLQKGVLSRSLHNYGPKHSRVQWTQILPTYVMKSRSQQILIRYDIFVNCNWFVTWWQ